MDWKSSRASCVSMGADLVIIESEAEQRFLMNAAKAQTAENRYWMGLTDSMTEGVWLWVDGTPLNDKAKYWYDKEPNDRKGVSLLALSTLAPHTPHPEHGALQAFYNSLAVHSNTELYDDVMQEVERFLLNDAKAHAGNRYWIGLTDTVTEGVWLWVDGTPLNDKAKYWYGNEPDDWMKGVDSSGEDYAHLMSMSDTLKAWSDQSCTQLKIRRICETMAVIIHI
ncbi:UNVERIFIED_CONTAM: hypothetical protein FKN15_056484 [Acipenser sinensis]